MAPRIVVVGLGPATADLVTYETLDLIEAIPHRFSRTQRHPSVGVLGDCETFDSYYESAADLDEVYTGIAQRLIDEARRHGEILYAVPGSPTVAERTIDLLRTMPGDVVVEICPAVSFFDLAMARLGVDPVVAGVRLVDGHSFAVEAAGEWGPLLVAQCDSRTVLSDIKLSVDEYPEQPVTVLQRLGLPDEHVATVSWEDLDRFIDPDHLTSLFVPRLGVPIAPELQRVAELASLLRRECPWDRAQTHQSLTRHLIEEAYEVVDAIEHLDAEAGEGYEHLEEELGDLLFQVMIHSVLAAEEGRFTVADVARNIHDKLVERHPHVFGDVRADSPDTVAKNWEQIKKREKGRESVMDGVPASLPALILAVKLQKKAANSGMRFPSLDQVLAKVVEETEEVRADPSEHEVGDLLFAATSVAFELSIDAEMALRRAARRFRDRFKVVERLAGEREIALPESDPKTIDTLWEEAKKFTPILDG